MNIPHDLQRFSEPSLLIVTGSQVARLFIAHNDLLDEAGQIENKTEDYIIHNENAAPGKTYGPGPNHENEQQVIQRDFDKKLKIAVEEALQSRHIEHVYLLAPSHMSNEMREALPQEAQKLIKKEIDGNYVKTHPLEILTKIS